MAYKALLFKLNAECDADLIDYINSASTHRRASAEIRRLMRLGLVYDRLSKQTGLLCPVTMISASAAELGREDDTLASEGNAVIE